MCSAEAYSLSLHACVVQVLAAKALGVPAHKVLARVKRLGMI